MTTPGSRPRRGEARDELLAAGLRLFAEQGFDATSTRQVATEAGVSHALLRYHFSSKAGLRDAVDEDVLGAFGRAFADVRGKSTSTDSLPAAGEAAARVFGADRERRRYVRRVLVDGTERGAVLFERLLSGADRELDRLLDPQAPLADQDHRWAAYQVLFLVLGPLLLELPMHAVLGADPFAPDTLAERSAANQRLLRRGLLPDS